MEPEKPILETEIVLHTSYGGFSYSEEMVVWLVENRGWTLIPEKDYDYRTLYPVTSIIESRSFYSSPRRESIELRTHRDLIDCVRTLQKLHENDSFTDRYYGHISRFSIQKLKVIVEIEDYHDGKEQVNCYGIARDADD